MATMRAWVYREKGHPAKVLKLENNFPKPTPAKGEVLIKVSYAALNPAGWKQMAVFPINSRVKPPAISEYDFSGCVVSGGSGFGVGDEVCGSIWNLNPEGRGTLCEYLTVPADQLVRVPKSISLAEAAAIGCVGTISYFMVATKSALKPNQRIFINGGSSGTGMIAVQVAKSLGAYVVTTASPASRAMVESLGADEVIDYRAVGDLGKHLRKTYSEDVKKFDLVCDCVGVASLYNHCASYLKKGCDYLDIAGSNKVGTAFLSFLSFGLSMVSRLFVPGWLGGVPRKYTFVLTPDELATPTLKSVVQLAADGKLKVVIDSEFEFGDALKAYERQMSWRAQGKVVVKVGE